MNLAYLSFARVGNHRKVPRVPTNDERMRAYRAATPAQFGNTFFHSARRPVIPAGQAATPPEGSGGRFLSTYGANARADAPVENAPPAIVVENSARTDLRPEVAQPGISAGRSTLTPARSPLTLSSGLSPVAGVAGNLYEEGR